MKSYVACFFFTLQTFCWKKKNNSIPAHISKYLLRPSHLIYYLNCQFRFIFLSARRGEQLPLYFFFFGWKYPIICGEENKQNRDNLSNFLTKTQHKKSLKTWRTEHWRETTTTHTQSTAKCDHRADAVYCVQIEFFFLVNGTRWTSTKCTIFYPPFDCTVLILYGYEKRQNLKKKKNEQKYPNQSLHFHFIFWPINYRLNMTTGWCPNVWTFSLTSKFVTPAKV